MDSLVMDLRYALRRLARSPGFTTVAVLSLALGIGANTAIFSLVDAILLRDLPFERPEELYDVYNSSPDFSAAPASYPEYRDLLEGTRDAFVDLAAMRLALVPVDLDDGAEMVPTEVVTGNWFSLLGVPAALGRTLLPEDDVSKGAHPVVALGWDYWQESFGGDPDVVGGEIRIAGRPWTVVGVISREYTGTIRGLKPGLFASSMMAPTLDGTGFDELEARGNHSWWVKGRIAPGATASSARGALDRMTADFRRDHPSEWGEDASLRLVPTAEVVVNPMMDRVLVPAFGMLLVVVGIVLLIACANLASFLLARATDRRREIAVRLAMGARRWVLVRQLLTETVLLAALGGLGGLVLARWLLDALTGADLPLPVPISLDPTLDGAVLVFTAAVSLGAGIFFGLAPALQATDPDVATTIRTESVGAGRRRGPSLRDLLVGGQVALSLALLVGAGLLLRSLLARQDVDPGFGYAPAALVSLQVPIDAYPDDEEARVFWRGLEERLETLAEVEEVGFTSNIHLNTLNTTTTTVQVPGVEPPPGQDFIHVDRASVDGDFFAAVGIDLIEGRVFGPGDGPDTDAVLVNRAFAERFWPGESAVGRTFTRGDESRAATVVGVVETARIRTLGEEPRPFLYDGGDHSVVRYTTLVATARGDAAVALSRVVATAREMEPRIQIFEARTLERHLATMMLPHRLSAIAAGVFAALAVVLASIGVYGVVSYAVARRGREVGIRMSLGASGGEVVTMLMMGGLKIVALGGAVGVLLSLALARVLGRFLFGVPALDPVTFVGVPALLLAVATLAAWVPARRAVRIQPSEALRAS